MCGMGNGESQASLLLLVSPVVFSLVPVLLVAHAARSRCVLTHVGRAGCTTNTRRFFLHWHSSAKQLLVAVTKVSI